MVGFLPDPIYTIRLILIFKSVPKPNLEPSLRFEACEKDSKKLQTREGYYKKLTNGWQAESPQFLFAMIS